MVEIKIQEKSYDIPTEWKDITLRYWCGLYSIINQYNKRDDEGNVIEAEHSEVELLKMNRDIFIYLTGVSHNEMNMLDVDSVNAAVATFSQTLEEYKPKGIDRFEFEGEEYLFPKESHKWLLLELDKKLVMVEKEKFWFKTGLDFGFLFLTWLQKTSVGYKVLMDTKPNFMTMRYEWKDNIDYVVSPTDKETLKYFTGYWDEEMVREFFPQKSKLGEFMSSVKVIISIFIRAIGGKYFSKKR